MNPMEDDNCMEETPCDVTKARIVPYKKTWRPDQNTVYWCNLKTRSEDRMANLSNMITRNRSLQHTACDMYYESGMHEDYGGVIPQGIPIPKVAT